ncbi:MAG TPA: OsmC family peroxiredoxin [Anaerolineae bacterium]|nr:OsmC family peroxiredoxin [Anaerolineae bacterium]HIQ05055.1 OsmC family peroxiredoxin [Anaerolineae bacterium]
MNTAKVTWVDGLQFVAEAGSGHAFVIDGDPKSGGAGTGARPMELLLLGLAGCTGMDVAHILRKQRQTFTGLQVNVQAERAETHPKVYTKIHVEYVVRGPVKEAALQKAIRLSEERFCSASAMLGKTAEITNSYRIEPE